jgi:hypothetical protein
MKMVGASGQTASLAVEALSQWRGHVGRRSYPEAKELLVLCDQGGCNSSKNRVWKYDLQGFVDHFGIAARVAHYPPGASKGTPSSIGSSASSARTGLDNP